MLRFLPQKKKYVPEENEFTFSTELPIPKHIAIIMDGNGRWAQNRRLPRVAGHKEGMEVVKKITMGSKFWRYMRFQLKIGNDQPKKSIF